MQVSNKMLVLAGVAVVLSASAPAFAHHSFAMFDAKEITLEGTVKEFQWTNPHCWLQVIVKDPQTGQEVEWSLEGASVNALSRQGLRRTSLKPGDKVTVVTRQLKDGSHGGSMGRITVNGQPLVRAGAPGPAAN